MKTKQHPSQEFISECLSYDSVTGVMKWKSRPLSHFKSKNGMIAWNAKFQGRMAGKVSKYIKSYIDIAINRQYFRAHRLVWILINGDIPDGMEIDHINGNGTDNRIENLRITTRTENARNLRKQDRNSSGTTGVYFDKSRNKWCARIGIGSGILKTLGRFDNKDDAIAARLKAEIEYNYHKNHGQDRPL